MSDPETVEAPVEGTSARRDEALWPGSARILAMLARGAALEDTLGSLARLVEAQEPDSRCVIVVVGADGQASADGAGPGLPANGQHVMVMGDAASAPQAHPCDLAMRQAAVVDVRDIAGDSRWDPAWRARASAQGFRACRCMPVGAADGMVLAVMAQYRAGAHDPAPGDAEYLQQAMHLATLALDRQRDIGSGRGAAPIGRQGTRIEDTLPAVERAQQARDHMADELTVMQRLQEISIRQVREEDVDALYRQILDAAKTIMASDAASVQVLDHARGELRLQASCGFHPDSAAFWEWVGIGSGSTCGEALGGGRRVFVEDVETHPAMHGSGDMESYRLSGIRAVQSTPLVSRSGQPLGMISTHWRRPHRPDEHRLRLLDVLARLAAGLIERKHSEESLQRESRAARAAEAHSELLLHELSHRVKNTLATVQSICIQTLQYARSMEAFETDFLARMAALAHTHDLLMGSRWRGAALTELLSRELMPYRGDGICRWTTTGSDVQLDAKTALALGMALHELATNAAKYGALSNACGRIAVQWRVERGPGGETLCLEWIEHDGPPVIAPRRRGFGSRLIERGLAYELCAHVRLRFPPSGARCTLKLPLPAVADPAVPAPLLPVSRRR